MTPTLNGRWQSRLFLLGTIGLFITLFFIWITNSLLPLFILMGVILFGILWDVLYTQIQKHRWDQDWPPVLQLATGVIEGIFIFVLLYGFGPQNALPPVGLFWLHYGLVWLTTFIASQSLMRLLFPRWRYQGGEWW